MLRRPLCKRLLVMLCLAVLQGQLWAASLLACQHLDGPVGAASRCPFHSPATGAAGDGSGTPLECPKCVLHCALGGFHPATALLGVVTPYGDATRRAAPASRWNDVTPERFLRPPRSPRAQPRNA